MKDPKGHGSNKRGITKVSAVRYSTEPGSSRRRVTVEHDKGHTSGYEDNLHMGALITRGLREGATVSGGSPAMGHKIDSGTVGLSNDHIAARALRDGSGHKSNPVPMHSSAEYAAGTKRVRPIRTHGWEK